MEKARQNGIYCPYCGELIAESVEDFEGDHCPHCDHELNELDEMYNGVFHGNEYRRCHDCGEWFSYDDTYDCPDGEVYCADCAERYFYQCERCGEWITEDDLVCVAESPRQRRRGDVEYYCRDCAEYYDYAPCADCGEWYSADNMYSTRDGDVICEDCADDWYYCEECDNYVSYDEWDSENECCNECARNKGSALIRSYHSRPLLRYIGNQKKQWRGIWRGLGIELEIDRHDHDSTAEIDCAEALMATADNDSIYFNRDGSLSNGFEIITQPHTEEAFWAMPWERLLDICKENGYQSHDIGTCGLHVHISREMFGTDEKKQGVAISKLIRFYDLFYGEILKISRRTESQAERWAGRYGADDRKTAEHYGKNKGCTSRYYAVNNTNRTTVEIRIMRGTLNYTTFCACIKFVLLTAKNSRRIPWAKVGNAAMWLKGIDDDTAAYLRKVGAFSGVID